jgi:DNA-binding NarL/FixJ family response regulator
MDTAGHVEIFIGFSLLFPSRAVVRARRQGDGSVTPDLSERDGGHYAAGVSQPSIVRDARAWSAGPTRCAPSTIAPRTSGCRVLGGVEVVPTVAAMDASARISFAGAPPPLHTPMTNTERTPREPSLRLLIVDDQPLIRRGLSMMLAAESGVEVVGQAADGAEAIDRALVTSPDVVVMDLQMPGVSGVAATREITRRLPGTRVVVLTTFDDDDLVFEAIRAGAHAYLLKDATEEEVLDTIRAVHRGESRLSPTIARKVMEQFRRLPADGTSASAQPAAVDAAHCASSRGPAREQPPVLAALESLTEKESRILDLIAQGKSNKQIAAAVFLAEGTVKNYVSRIMDKLHAGSRIELAIRAAGRR